MRNVFVHAVVALAGLAATGVALAIPHAAFAPRIDGDLSDWRSPMLERVIAETQAPGPERNRLRVRLAWTAEALLIAGEIDDDDLIPAPPGITPEQFHHYDSVQVYLDPFADSTRRMNSDDLDLLLLPDGRSGVLRGDELVATLAAARVPQRQSAPLLHEYAAQVTATGWRFELALPWAGIGRDAAQRDALRMDVAMNDWVVAHPPAPPSTIDLNTAAEAASDQPASEVGTQLWPLDWQGGRDFGYPERWLSLTPIGGPPPLERAMHALGPRRLAVLGVILLGMVGFAAHALGARRATRHLRQLLATWPIPAVNVDAGRPEHEASTAPSAPSAPVAGRDRVFAEQVRAHVRANLRADLSPPALAEAMHVSLRSLQRRLRDGMDTSPQELVLAARLSAAHALLVGGGLRVSEVADRVGFEDLSHFSRRFRAAYGVPPSRVDSHRVGPDRVGPKQADAA